MNGTKWLSLVLWGTPAMTQKLLMQKLDPFVGQNGTMDKINQWFFVRYWDTLPQLRFRVFINFREEERIKKELEERLEPYLQAHQLWKLEWVAYQPELERYGKENMVAVERLFHLQSQWAMQLFRQLFSEEKRLQKLLQFCPLLLRTVFSSSTEIQIFIRMQHTLFEERLNDGQFVTNFISRAYRRMAPSIDVEKNAKRECTGLANGMIKAMVQLKNPYYDKAQLTRDLLHMLVNKCFLTDHAQWEFLLYEFLDRTFRSYLARRQT